MKARSFPNSEGSVLDTKTSLPYTLQNLIVNETGISEIIVICFKLLRFSCADRV